ncbi:MAG: response regulator [Bacteroidetes bacterium]|nr:response regulator [Bacteroidota bacterium]
MSNAELLKKRIERERLARKQAEEILEKKSLELYAANEKLQLLNLELEKAVEKRTAELKSAKIAAEKAQLAEKEFLAKMSHEIRTPLNAVVGMANLLHTTSLNDIQEEYVDDIKYAADVLMGLISDVLDISKIEAGELALNESEFDLRESLNALVRTLDYKARENDNELVVFIDHQVPELILADKNVINQILLNLIGNALKFTTKGTISINVNVLIDGEGNSQLQFEIIDTGKGIEPEKLASIFEKYQQENKAIKVEYGGTGLGLSICKELVQLHGGKIWAESKVGEGSTFSFTVKVAPIMGNKGEGNEEVVDYNNQLGGKILVVEDSYLNLKYLLTLLNSWEVDYDVAYDGEEAVKLCAKEQYQLIFMDMQMPKMNGYDATKNIRNFSVLNSETPIVALTASALLEDQRAAEYAGVNSHLIKPFSPGQLKRVISQYANYQDKDNKKKTSKQGKFNDEEWQVLSEYFDGDTEHARIVVESFMSSNKENMKLMADYLDNNEFDSVTALMHKCKPSLAMVGLRELSNLAAEIESLLKSNKNNKAIELIDDFLPKLNKDLPRVEQFYQKLKNE